MVCLAVKTERGFEANGREKSRPYSAVFIIRQANNARRYKYKTIVESIFRELRNIERKAQASLEQLNTRVVVPLVEELLGDLKERYRSTEVEQDLAEVEKNVISSISRFHQKEEPPQASVLGMQIHREEHAFLEYQVNVVVDNAGVHGRPVIIETNPKYNNLFGTIERAIDRQGVWRTDFTHIKAGSLIRADGGFLVVNALDALVEPWIWTTLKRVLRNRQNEIQPAESGILGTTVGLRMTSEMAEGSAIAWKQGMAEWASISKERIPRLPRMKSLSTFWPTTVLSPSRLNQSMVA